MDNAYQLIFNMGIFTADSREWNKRAADDKTLPHLKVFFAAAHREWRLLIQNETGAPYGAAHNATANPDDGYLQQETVDAIVNLVIATASDCTAITQLTSTVERLMAELLAVNAKLVTALQRKRVSQGGRGGRDRGRGHGRETSAPAQTGAVAATRFEEQDPEPLIHYCWKCSPGCRHNIAKCSAPSTGHIYTATKRDMQGGAEATR